MSGTVSKRGRVRGGGRSQFSGLVEDGCQAEHAQARASSLEQFASRQWAEQVIGRGGEHGLSVDELSFVGHEQCVGHGGPGLGAFAFEPLEENLDRR